VIDEFYANFGVELPKNDWLRAPLEVVGELLSLWFGLSAVVIAFDGLSEGNSCIQLAVLTEGGSVTPFHHEIGIEKGGNNQLSNNKSIVATP